jgi:hypothetical protein
MSEFGTSGLESTEEQREELVEQVAREIQLRGLTARPSTSCTPAVPTGLWAPTRCCSSIPSCAACSGRPRRATAILADDDGIEQLIERLEELDEEIAWDA